MGMKTAMQEYAEHLIENAKSIHVYCESADVYQKCLLGIANDLLTNTHWIDKEKQQIIDAYKSGVDGTRFAEQYYNDTFKQD